MKAARRIRAKLKGGELVTGVLATFHLWPGLVEVLRRAGLDYIIVDLEHGAYSDTLVAEVCAVGRHQDFAVFVRPPKADFDAARTAMDRGPCGFLLPSVCGASAVFRCCEFSTSFEETWHSLRLGVYWTGVFL